MEYKIVKNDRGDLEIFMEEVGEKIADGFEPLGGPTVNNFGIIQAMIKRPGIEMQTEICETDDFPTGLVVFRNMEGDYTVRLDVGVTMEAPAGAGKTFDEAFAELCADLTEDLDLCFKHSHDFMEINVESCSEDVRLCYNWTIGFICALIRQRAVNPKKDTDVQGSDTDDQAPGINVRFLPNLNTYVAEFSWFEKVRDDLIGYGSTSTKAIDNLYKRAMRYDDWTDRDTIELALMPLGVGISDETGYHELLKFRTQVIQLETGVESIKPKSTEPESMNNTGKKNLYICQKCDNHLVTIDMADGVTPFLTQCPVPGCTGMAQSKCYKNFDAIYIGEPTVRWIRPTNEQTKRLPPDLRDHVKKGGLIRDDQLQAFLKEPKPIKAEELIRKTEARIDR